jgi:N-hydroxyarylamine O-acetyltransferase
MSDTIDLPAYFTRIGYDGPVEPTYPVLAALQGLHPRAIPFENLDVLLKRPVRIDLASIQAKLVAGSRGGYCFEQNGLFLAVLRQIGFDATGLSARVLWGRPEGAAAARTHMLTRIELPEGAFLCDVGFGGVVQTAPLRLEPNMEQDTGLGLYRLVPMGDELLLQFKLPAGWAPVYRLSLTPTQPIDYEMSNWFVSTHPGSPFTVNLMASWIVGDRRYGLTNNNLSIHHHEGPSEKRALSAAELAEMLHDTFGLARPADETEMAALYDALVARGAIDPRA